MKILKLYMVFAVLVLSLCFIGWILGFTSTDEIFDILQKAGSVLGILFISTLLVQAITKPQNRKRK